MKEITCPNCGYSFEPIPGRDRIFCAACGTAICIIKEEPDETQRAEEITGEEPEAESPETEEAAEESPDSDENGDEEISDEAPDDEISDSVNSGNEEAEPAAEEDTQTEEPYHLTAEQAENSATEPKKKSLKTPIIIVAAAALIIGLFILLYYLLLRPIYITSIKISKSDYDKDREAVVLHIGDVYEADYTLSPADNRYDDVTWSSSDDKVAKAENGRITAAGKGECTVTAVSENGVKAEIEIFVEVPAEEIVLSASAVKISKGETAVISVGFTPAEATDKHCTWETSDKKVATVKDGIITAVGTGTCTITVTSVYGPSAECTVKVTKPSPESLIVGNWTGIVGGNRNTGSIGALSKGEDTMIIYADGTAVNYYGKNTYNLTWKYYKVNEDGDYLYRFYFENGAEGIGMYFNSGTSMGNFEFVDAGTATVYEKTTTEI